MSPIQTPPLLYHPIQYLNIQEKSIWKYYEKRRKCSARNGTFLWKDSKYYWKRRKEQVPALCHFPPMFSFFSPLPAMSKGLQVCTLSVSQSVRLSVKVSVFQTFFLNACRYWTDFWHVSQSPWLTDRVWVSLRSIDFWRNYRPWT